MIKMVPNKGKQTLRKGNGKPKEQAKASLSKPNPVVKKESVEPVEIKENTLTFPLLKTVDNGRLMPRYTSIINRTEEEGVRFEDLDILKIELKGLLANVSVRVRVLQGELKNLASVADEKKEKKRQMMDKAPASPAKRGKYGRELVSSPPSKITRVKSITVNGPIPPSAALPPEPEPPRIITPRNDNSSKFWQSLEQYCSDITPMDIKFLEECIRCREKGPEMAPIPRLGEHFASRWAKEDLRVEQEASSSSGGERRGAGTSAIVGRRATLAKGSDANAPFTQRLVSALIEDTVISTKEIVAEPVCKDGENITPLKSNKIVNSGSVNSSNSVSLEKIVMKELEEQGLLEKESQPKAPPNDEIMREINRAQSELAAIIAYNCKMLKQVLHMAREQIPRQELKKKLKIVDDEVRDVYKKFAAAKLKKRLPSKREKEQAWRVLKERDYLLRHLYGRGSRSMHARAAQHAMMRPSADKMAARAALGPEDKLRLAMHDKAVDKCGADKCGPVKAVEDKLRLVAHEKAGADKSGVDRQPVDGGYSERKPLEKLSEKTAPRAESSFGKPNCVSLGKPETTPAMDAMLQ